MKETTKMRILTLLSLFGLILTPSIEALTTFGKTNPQKDTQNTPPQPTPGGKSRSCKMESDCRGIQNTTCIADSDGKTRCLCSDFSAPVNGACTNIYKGVRFPCNDDIECGPYGQCVQKNNTALGKRCECREGVEEVNRICNGSSPTVQRISMAILLTVLGKFLFL